MADTSMITQNDLMRVLVGEDDDDDFLIFSLAVEEVSYKVVLSRATDGDTLMAMLHRELPDILFLDLRLPGKDGKQCLHLIRADRRFDKLPVIIYSSLDDLENISYCYREGSNMFTVKPNSIGDLRVILQRIFTLDWKKNLYYPPLEEFVLRGSA